MIWQGLAYSTELINQYKMRNYAKSNTKYKISTSFATSVIILSTSS